MASPAPSDVSLWLRNAMLADIRRHGLEVPMKSYTLPEYVVFPEPDLPVQHVPSFGKDFNPVTNEALCLRCRRPVDRYEWAGGLCDGPIPALLMGETA